MRTYLGKTGSKEDTLVDISHLPKELIYVRPLENVHLMHRAVDLYPYFEVRLIHRL